MEWKLKFLYEPSSAQSPFFPHCKRLISDNALKNLGFTYKKSNLKVQDSTKSVKLKLCGMKRFNVISTKKYF